MDLEAEIAVLKEELKTANWSKKRVKAVRRLDVLDAFYKSGKQARMDGSQHPSRYSTRSSSDGPIGWWPFCCLDLNDLYRRVINRNNRLARLLELNALYHRAKRKTDAPRSR